MIAKVFWPGSYHLKQLGESKIQSAWNVKHLRHTINNL